MIPFGEYSQQLKRKFVGLYFTKESEEAIRRWALSAGFDLTTRWSGAKQDPSLFDFHTTVFYTTSYHDTEEGWYPIEPFILEFDHFELLGKNADTPVLKVDTENWTLQKLREGFEEMGYKDEWPSYKPHVSLSYAWDGKPDINRLEVPRIKVTANRIKVQDVKEEGA